MLSNIILVDANIINNINNHYNNLLSSINVKYVFYGIVVIILLINFQFMPKKIRYSKFYRKRRREILAFLMDSKEHFLSPQKLIYNLYTLSRKFILYMIRCISLLKSELLSFIFLKIYISDMSVRDVGIILDYRELSKKNMPSATKIDKYDELEKFAEYDYGIEFNSFKRILENYLTQLPLGFNHILSKVKIKNVERIYNGNVSCIIEYYSKTRNIPKINFINNASLMWDNNKKAYETYNKLYPKMDDLECESKVSKALIPNFGKLFTEIVYDNISILWFDNKSLWPPAIDTFLMIEKIREHSNLLEEDINIVVDVGSGTGILGIWLAKNNKSVSSLYMTDWLLTPLFFSKANVVRNNLVLDNIQVDLALNSCLNCDIFKENSKIHKKANVMLCNPPYLPILPRYKELAPEHTTMGTELLLEVIEKGTEYSEKVFINYSNLVQPDVDELLKNDNNIDIIGLGDPVLVPFRVRIALENENYLKALIKERNLKVIHDDITGHHFWHEIQTYEVYRK